MGVQSIDDLQAALREHEYVADRGLATAIFLSLNLGRPLFLEGEAGVGKTEVAKVVARLLETELIRLQCYEGLDVHHAVYEWNYSRQMMHIRLAESRKEQTDEAELFGPQSLLKRPLLQAIEESRDKAPVLLVDDRASVARSLSKKTVLLLAGSAEDSRRKPSPKPVPVSPGRRRGVRRCHPSRAHSGGGGCRAHRDLANRARQDARVSDDRRRSPGCFRQPGEVPGRRSRDFGMARRGASRDRSKPLDRRRQPSLTTRSSTIPPYAPRSKAKRSTWGRSAAARLKRNGGSDSWREDYPRSTWLDSGHRSASISDLERPRRSRWR